jgi:hypothetical protein
MAHLLAVLIPASNAVRVAAAEDWTDKPLIKIYQQGGAIAMNPSHRRKRRSGQQLLL